MCWVGGACASVSVFAGSVIVHARGHVGSSLWTEPERPVSPTSLPAHPHLASLASHIYDEVVLHSWISGATHKHTVEKIGNPACRHALLISAFDLFRRPAIHKQAEGNPACHTCATPKRHPFLCGFLLIASRPCVPCSSAVDLPAKHKQGAFHKRDFEHSHCRIVFLAS